MREAPSSAFLRRCIGVAPVCASWPATVTSYQRMPCTPVTTPIILAFRLQDRPLLDVQLEHRADLALSRPARCPCSRCASARRRTPCRRGRGAIGEVTREGAGEHAGGQHRRREARALLVGPVDDLERRVGLVAGRVQACASPRARRARRARRRTCRRWAACRDASPCRSAAGRRACPDGARTCCRQSSTVTVQPIASQARLNQSRTLRSSSDSVSRQMPPFAVPPKLRRLHQAVPQPLRVDRQIGAVGLGRVVTVSLMAPPACARRRPRRREFLPGRCWRHATAGNGGRGDELAVAFLGAQLAVLPGDAAARERDARRAGAGDALEHVVVDAADLGLGRDRLASRPGSQITRSASEPTATAPLRG